MARRIDVYVLVMTAGPVARRRQHLAHDVAHRESLARHADAQTEAGPFRGSAAAPVLDAGLALLYKTVPARRVPLAAAFGGAFAAALAFEGCEVWLRACT